MGPTSTRELLARWRLEGGMMLVDIESLESGDAGVEGGGAMLDGSSHGSGY